MTSLSIKRQKINERYEEERVQKLIYPPKTLKALNLRISRCHDCICLGSGKYFKGMLDRELHKVNEYTRLFLEDQERQVNGIAICLVFSESHYGELDEGERVFLSAISNMENFGSGCVARLFYRPHDNKTAWVIFQPDDASLHGST